MSFQRKKTVLFSAALVAVLALVACVLLGVTKGAPRPLFSVILSTYNNASFVPHAVESVVRQNFDSWELIIVNDGSTDDTQSFLDTLTHEKIKIISRAQNKGLSASRNEALRHARGKYVWFLDADDKIAPGAMKSLQNKIDQTGADMISFKVRVTDETGQEIQDDYCIFPPEVLERPQPFRVSDVPLETILQLPVTSGKTIYRRAFLEKNEIIFPEGTVFEDNVFFLHSLFAGATFWPEDKVFYLKLKHPGAITSQEEKHFASMTRLPILIFDRLSALQTHPFERQWIFVHYLAETCVRYARLPVERQKFFESDLKRLAKEVSKRMSLPIKENLCADF